MKPTDLKQFIHALMLVACMAYYGDGFAANTWNYLQETDRLTNLSYSYALSPLPRRDLYDDIKLEIVCKNKQLQVNINTEDLIASQGRKFDASYQIDKNPSIPLQMKTFPDSKRKGYSDGQAPSIIQDLLAGKETVFLRITTITKQVLSGAISLEGAAQPIRQVLADCGADVDTAQANDGKTNAKEITGNYGLAAFEKDFRQLTAEQQKQLLSQIQKWLAALK